MRCPRRLPFLCAGVLLLSDAATAQRASVSRSVPSVVASGNLLAIARWMVTDAELTAVVANEGANAAPARSLSTKALEVYRKRGAATERIFRFETPDVVVNLYPLGELGARLFTSWVGGSAYHIRVFAYEDGHVRQVLDAASRGMPEVTIDDQEREAILVTHMEMKDGQWSRGEGTTDVYKWNGKTYDSSRTVSWRDRFQCVANATCTSVK